MVNQNNKKVRTYRMIRIHDGVAEALPCTYDKQTQTITFQSDCFSTYGLTYADSATGSNVPDTGDHSRMTLWVGLLLISGGMMTSVAVCRRKRSA